MYRVAADGTFLEFRLGETARLPVDSDDLVGMNVRDILSPEASDAVFAAMRRALENDTVELVNYTLQWEGDPLRHLEARIVRSGDDEAVAIVRDITPRKLQEQALEALAEGRAALSRVAVAVAKAERPEAVFDVVTEEVARLLGADAANLVRFVDLEAEQGRDRGEVERARHPDRGGRHARAPRPRPPRPPPPDRASRAEAAPTTPTCRQRLAARLKELGVTSLVAAPITVSGSLWGAVVVSVTGDKTFEETAEERLSEFANLVAVALANAEAREQLAGLAEGRAALSRVAVAVATASDPRTCLRRRHGGGRQAVRRRRREPDALRPAERERRADRREMEHRGDRDHAARRPSRASRRCDHAGAPDGTSGARITSVTATTRSRSSTRALTELGVTSLRRRADRGLGRALGRGRRLARPSDEQFAEDAEERLVQFGKLVSVALANAQAREDLAALAEEQAALSRVAVAVATGELPERLFDAVSEEVGGLFGARSAATVRYLPASGRA